MRKILLFTFTIMTLINLSAKVFSQSITTRPSDVVVTETPGVTAFPNPADKEITFTFKGMELPSVVVEVYEITGLFSTSFKPENDIQVLNVSEMKEGLYFYKVLYNGKVLITEKFVILRK